MRYKIYKSNVCAERVENLANLELVCEGEAESWFMLLKNAGKSKYTSNLYYRYWFFDKYIGVDFGSWSEFLYVEEC